MDNLLRTFSDLAAAVVSRAASSVITIHARPRIASSAIVWSNGLAVTADHTVTRTEEIHAGFADGQRVEARLKARDAATGIALIEFDAPGIEAVDRSLEPDLRPGSLLFAVGRNADTGPTAAMGILSAAGGPWRTWRGGHLDRFLRLDMNLHPSAAGGIVVDSEGRFAGMASDGLSRLSPLAVPVATLERVITELRDKGRVARGYLGVGLQSVELASGPGVIVLSIEPDSSADKGGLLVGDVITALDEVAIAGPEDVRMFLSGRSPGMKIATRIVRGGQNIELTVELGDRSK